MFDDFSISDQFNAACNNIHDCFEPAIDFITDIPHSVMSGLGLAENENQPNYQDIVDQKSFPGTNASSLDLSSPYSSKTLEDGIKNAFSPSAGNQLPGSNKYLHEESTDMGLNCKKAGTGDREDIDSYPHGQHATPLNKECEARDSSSSQEGWTARDAKGDLIGGFTSPHTLTVSTESGGEVTYRVKVAVRNVSDDPNASNIQQYRMNQAVELWNKKYSAVISDTECGTGPECTRSLPIKFAIDFVPAGEKADSTLFIGKNHSSRELSRESVSPDGKTVYAFPTTTAGTYAHELGHFLLGAPDLYYDEVDDLRSIQYLHPNGKYSNVYAINAKTKDTPSVMSASPELDDKNETIWWNDFLFYNLGHELQSLLNPNPESITTTVDIQKTPGAGSRTQVIKVLDKAKDLGAPEKLMSEAERTAHHDSTAPSTKTQTEKR